MAGASGQTAIEMILLADRAEAMNGKLYVMGGGWDRLHVSAFPSLQPLAVALSVSVPASDATPEHFVRLDIDGPNASLTVRGTAFRRQSPPGSSRRPARAVMAINTIATLGAPGHYTLTAVLDDGRDRAEVDFEVLLAPA